MGKKQRIAEQEAALNWYADQLGKADQIIFELEQDKGFLVQRINALESIIDDKQEVVDSLKATNDSLLEILDSLPD